MNEYNKKPVWMWILIYAVIGGLVYAGVYYFVLVKRNPDKGIYSTIPTEETTETKKDESLNVTPGAAAQSEQNIVTLTKDGFEPKTLSIKVGDKVTWTNKSGVMGNVSSDPHPIHTSYAALNLGNLKDGASVSLVFDKPGTYRYHDHLDSQKTGTIIVK